MKKRLAVRFMEGLVAVKGFRFQLGLVSNPEGRSAHISEA